MPNIAEKLVEAEHSLGFALDALMEANTAAGPVEHLAVLPLIEAAASLSQRVQALRAAVQTTQET